MKLPLTYFEGCVCSTGCPDNCGLLCDTLADCYLLAASDANSQAELTRSNDACSWTGEAEFPDVPYPDKTCQVWLTVNMLPPACSWTIFVFHDPWSPGDPPDVVWAGTMPLPLTREPIGTYGEEGDTLTIEACS